MAKQILIIEDDRLISEMYARSLTKAGYEVEEVVTGPEGYDKAKSGHYAFILLDILIPDKSGVEVLQELRGSDGNGLPESRIIVMTNFQQEDAIRQSMEKLADGYLIKAEITPSRLVRIIQTMDQELQDIKEEPKTN